MADLNGILAALAAQRQNGPPSQAPPPGPGYATQPQYSTPPGGGYLPQPISSGSVDLAGIKPVNSGSVSIADAIAKARGIAAERGISYDPERAPSRNNDPRAMGRNHRRSRSPSRSPPRTNTNYRDNYNPYRDERRGNDRNYNRERSPSPRRGGHYSPGFQDDRSPGRDRGDPESEILPIEKSLVGLIIGRNGENLRRVENTTGARVQFMDGPETTSAQRHCKLSGNRAARALARQEIFKIIDENESAKRGQDKPRPQTKQAAPPAPSKDGDSTQVLVPDRTVGLIIGRGGETIRDLQERSGCHVNIVGENKSVNGMRPVNLIGSAAAQQQAKDLIFEIVESDQKGISIKDLRSRDQDRDRDRDRGRDDDHGKITDQIVVPGEAVGMIIGKGGESIKDMQNQTGCKINVSAPSGRDIEREIGLVGSRHAIEAAKRAIMEKVDTVRARGQVRERDEYGERYPTQQPSNPYAPAAAMPQPPVAGVPAAGNAADPYAPYGGYQNYLQMWYAAVAAQQQQPPPGAQGPGEPR